MWRLLGISMSLLGMLAVVWLGWDKGLPGYDGGQPPQFWEENAETEASTEAAGEHDPAAEALLIARSLLPYDGPALWDEGEALSAVAALELWNAGQQTIRYAEVVVRQGERVLTFTATYIPPGGMVIVPEKDRKAYTRDSVTDISYPVVTPMEGAAGSEGVSVTENGAFALSVTNGTAESFSCIRVFYKQYDSEHGAYVGGTTYSAVLTDMQPGESRALMLYRYAAGYAKIVAVVAEKEQPAGCS